MHNILSLPEELLEAYLKTDYTFEVGAKKYVIRLDDENSELLSFLREQNITSWAYLTAWNPLSQPQTEEFNQSLQQLLLEKLNDHKIYKGVGKSRDESWPGEESFFVANISRNEATALGLDFGQNAILVSKEDLLPALTVLYPAIAHN